MFNKKLISTTAAATLLAGGMVSMPASADLSANIGFASEYYFRGILQKETSASGGLDYETGGFYIGTWTADVGDGLEVDGYLGYNLELGDVTLGAGVAGYYYTGEFDDTYEEATISASWEFASISYTFGTWDNDDGFDGEGGDEYDFIDVTLSHNGFYGTVGIFGQDADGEYLEIGYGTEIGGFDVGVAAIFSSDELSDQADDDGDATESEAFVFTLSKSFDL
ncbi:MAG: TorF family putative porin [Halioglobus sp.]|nr:TorF family putative porin [Halioglobus sp.]